MPGFLRQRGLAKIVHSLRAAVPGDELSWLLAGYRLPGPERARLEAERSEIHFLQGDFSQAVADPK